MSDHKDEYARLLELVVSDTTNFFVHLYHNHLYIAELAVGLLMVYIAYRFGRSLNRSATVRKIELLNAFEQSKGKLTETQHNTANMMRKLRLPLKVLAVIVAIGNVVLHLQSEQLNRWLVRQGLVPLVSLGERLAVSFASAAVLALLWYSTTRYQKYVEEKTKSKLKSLEYQETSEFDSLIKILGEQAIRRIKLKLCKETILRLNREQNQAVCTKERCLEEKKLLQDSYQLHSLFIRRVTEFKWCDVCSSRKKIDKLKELDVAETAKVYASEYDEVKDKTSSLSQEAVKLVNYISQLCQAHCSARFWKHSREIGRTYKQEREVNQQRRAAFEQLRQQRAG